MSNPRFSHRRSAFTLVECLATLSVLMVLGLAASTLLAKVTQIGLDTNHDKSSRQMVLRLSRQLRSDVQSADSIDLSDDGLTMDLKDGPLVISYQVSSQPLAIDRAVKQSSPDAVASSERYSLPEKCDPLFSQDSDAITLRLTSPKQRSVWTVEAVKP